MTTQSTQRGGLSDFDIHPYTTSTGSSKQWQHFWSSVLKYFTHSVKFLFVSPLIYCTGALYACGGTRPRAPLCTVSGSFCFTCGIMLLETKGILFMWAVLQRAWPWACARPGSAALCSGLAWPQSAFLSHAAPDLLTHFLTQEIELTPQPGPWDPTDAYTAVH